MEVSDSKYLIKSKRDTVLYANAEWGGLEKICERQEVVVIPLDSHVYFNYEADNDVGYIEDTLVYPIAGEQFDDMVMI